MSQTALVIPAHQGAFEIMQIPIYSPGDGELLIKVHAAGLNPADWKLYKTNFAIKTYPAVLGIDRVGEIVQIGPNVVGFERGDRVATTAGFILNKLQGFQQYAIADATVTSKIPENVTYDEAATIPLTLSTAFSGFFAEAPYGAGLQPPFNAEAQSAGSGKAVLIIGGGSCVGQYAIQCAKLAGFSTIIATASLKNENLLESTGATHILDRNMDAQALVSSISPLTATQPPYFVFDAIGVPETERLGIAIAGHWYNKTNQKGIFVSVDPMPSEYASSQNTVRVSKVVAGPYVPWNVEMLSTVFHDKLYSWLEDGTIKPNPVEVIGGLLAIPGALKRLENNEISGKKLIVHPHASD